jgi:hypothetical protein
MTADNSFKYYDGTAWRIIKTPKYYDGTAWRVAKEIKYYTGTAWQTVYLAATVPVITSQPTSQTYTPSAPTITAQPTSQTSNAGSPTIGTQPTSQTANAGTPTITSQPTTQSYTPSAPTITAQPTNQSSSAGTPTITSNPSNSTVTAPATASFSVSATSPDSGTLTYQWQKSTDSGANYYNVTDGTGGTSTTYTTPSTTTGMSGYRYRCQVTNTKANNVTFSLTATAGGTLSYQWKTSGGTNVGTNSNSYTTNTGGSYYCVVTNTQTGNVTFNIAATSPDSGTLSYQWKTSAGTNVGTNSTSYTTSTAGNYYCVVTNTKTNSNTFSIAATSPDSGTISYLWYINGSSTGVTSSSYTTSTAGSVYCAVTNTKANNNTFSITATAGGTLSYQWKLNGSNVGTNASTYTTNSAGTVNCVVTNTQTGNVTFNISATGNGTLSYLWNKDNVSTGVTTTSYTTSAASSNITCLVTNTRNGVGAQQLSNQVSSTTTGTASTTSSSVTSTVNTTTTTNSNTVTSTINTTATATSNTVTANTSGTASTNSNTVTASIATTSSANSSGGILTVNAPAPTNVRPSGFPAGTNAAWVNSGNTVDNSWGDTTTYGNSSRFGNYPLGDWLGYVELTWSSQATSTSTLYLQIGAEVQDLLGSAIGAAIYYSTNGGTSYTFISTYLSTGGDQTASAFSAILPANVNLSSIRVKAEVHSYKDGLDVDFAKIRIYDAYIAYT